jgi:hypothetical protein
MVFHRAGILSLLYSCCPVYLFSHALTGGLFRCKDRIDSHFIASDITSCNYINICSAKTGTNRVRPNRAIKKQLKISGKQPIELNIWRLFLVELYGSVPGSGFWVQRF